MSPLDRHRDRTPRDRAEDTDVHTLTGAYALDALDDVERARTERHLETCADCAAEVASFRETAARLATGVAAGPPASLRDRVMAEIAHTRQDPPLAAPVRPAAARASAATRWLAVAASSLLVLSLGLGAVAMTWRSDADRARQAAAEMSEVLADPDRTVLDAEFGTGHGTIVVAGDRMVLVGDDVEAPPAGHGFQLWMIDEDGARPSVMLEPAGDGSYWAAAEGVRPGDAFGVTIEVEQGAQTPSDELVLITEA